MDWQQRMTDALNYIEKHLTNEINIDKAASKANCSTFHFMRMFEVVTGISPAEYIRRRRLSCAAIELASSNKRILDIALKYGYESPDAFTRAFRREFECIPSDARIPGATLHTYPPLSFTITLKGDKAMEYRIENGSEIKLTGITIQVNNQDGTNFIDVPAFWDKIEADGRFQKLCAKSAKSKLGVLGICHDFNMKTGVFSYSIAIETPANCDDLPEECHTIVVPATTWAKFTSRGPLRPNFQNTIKRIYSEWFPSSGREHAGTAEIEYYGNMIDCASFDCNSPDYWCEYWVPLK